MQLIDGLTIKASGFVTQQTDTNWRIVAAKDVDGDQQSDLIWWHSTTGQVKVDHLDGLTIKSSVTAAAQPNADWKLVGTGDATGDKKADLLWRNSVTGQVKLQTDLTQAGIVFYTESNLDWKILALVDLNGDGKSDIVWKNRTTGQVFGQLLNGTTVTASGVIYTEPNQAWQLVHTADFNGDGKSDLLWRNTSQGDVFLQLMDGLTISASQLIYNEPDAQWRIVPAQDQTGMGSLSVQSALGKAKPSKRPNPPGYSRLQQLQMNALSINTTAVYYVHADHLGTPRAITRPSDNKVVWKWDNTEPFGNSQPNENPSGLGAFEFNGRFPGQTHDKETGTFYNYYRDCYDPRTGRYCQSDPIGLAGGINTYGYVGGNPLSYIDPEGLAPPKEDGNPGGIGGGNIVRGNGFGYPATDPRVAYPRPGIMDGANYAQRTYSPRFSKDGNFAGRSVKDVADDLLCGKLKPSDVPVDYIVRNGNTLILNTRSAQALESAGIPRSQWTAVNRTGQQQFEQRLSDQLTRNGLDSRGIPNVRPSGGS